MVRFVRLFLMLYVFSCLFRVINMNLKKMLVSFAGVQGMNIVILV